MNGLMCSLDTLVHQLQSGKNIFYIKDNKYFLRGSSRIDQLKLNLVFDVSSNQLPTKMNLEIKDSKGRLVFR